MKRIKTISYFHTFLQLSHVFSWMIPWGYSEASFIGSTSRTQSLALCSARSLRSSLQNNEFMGLNDDGDFLLYGINAEDPTSDKDTSDISDIQMIPGIEALSFLGINSSYNDSPSTVTKTAPPPFPTASTDHTTTRNDDFISPDEEQIISDVEVWLLNIIPSLCLKDSKAYARELFYIGFDPACVTQCELQLDDLHFMKLLHQRYFYNEVTGKDHPWDP
jgi:hypothetical protein